MSVIAYSSAVAKGAITCHGGAIKRGQASMKRLFDFWLTSFNNFNFSPSPLLNHITLFVHEEGAAATFSNVLGGAENLPPKLAGTFGV